MTCTKMTVRTCWRIDTFQE